MSHAVKLKQERMVWLGLGLTGSVLIDVDGVYLHPAWATQLRFEQKGRTGK